MWKVPTSGRPRVPSASQPISGAIGSWTCTHVVAAVAQLLAHAPDREALSARFETAPLAGSPIVRPSETTFAGSSRACGARAAMQAGASGVVRVVGRQDPRVVAGGGELRRERLDVARDPAGIRPRVRRDQRDAHRANVVARAIARSQRATEPSRGKPGGGAAI